MDIILNYESTDLDEINRLARRNSWEREGSRAVSGVAVPNIGGLYWLAQCGILSGS